MAAPRSAPLSGRTPPPDWDRVAAWALAHLEELVEETGAKVRRGRCACPLHGGDNPEAFSVSPKGWHCWTGACGGGDGVAFVAALHHGHLPKEEARMAALRELAPRAGVFLEDRPSRGTRGGAKAGAPGLTQRPPRRAGVGALSGLRESPEGRPPGGPERKAAPDPALPFGMGKPLPEAVETALRELRDNGAVPASRSAVFGTVLETLTLGPQGRAYLEGRGFDPDAAAAYGFRSVEHRDGWAVLLAALAGEYHPAELAAANLAKLPGDRPQPWLRLAVAKLLTRPGDRPQPWLRLAGNHAAGTPALQLEANLPGRVPALVLPYTTPEGAAWTFRTRTLVDYTGPGKGPPRYLELSGDRIPYPFNAPALAGLTREHELHLVEGELNAYALHVHGLRACSAGAAGTWRSEWTAAVARAGRLVAWYDADDAGNNGWRKLTEALEAELGRGWTKARVRRVKIEKRDGRKDAADLHRRGELAPTLEEAEWRMA